ncbi:MAG: hypothetical protein LBK99_05770 [Opitutaceae bacterium]|nr:hypothetical protein [Opitutaceae bacterium]
MELLRVLTIANAPVAATPILLHLPLHIDVARPRPLRRHRRERRLRRLDIRDQVGQRLFLADLQIFH